MRDNKFYKIGATVLTLLVVIIMTLMILGKRADNKTAKSEEDAPATVSSSNVIEDTVSINDFDDLEEIASESDSQSQNTITDNESTSDANNSNANTNNAVTNENLSATNAKITSKNESEPSSSNSSKQEPQQAVGQMEDPVFSYPVEGEVTMEYAKDKLVYSSTLGEWITHTGIDIKAEKKTLVKASAAGTIKSIKNDPRFGLTVVIEHINGYSTVYSNLLTAEFISVGENVSEGQTIGTVGNTAAFEVLDESHLHFEILKNNESIDPTMYLKN